MKERRVIYRPLILFIALIAALSSPVFAKDLQMNSEWASQPIKLDGKISEWPEGTTSFLGIPEATLGLSNDSERVYIALAFRRTDWARLIHVSGLTLWLDGNGKKEKGFMIHFVGGPPMEEIMALSAKYGEILPGRADSTRQARMKEMESKLENKFTCAPQDGAKEQSLPVDGTLGPAVAFGIDQGFFVYEFSIPLKAGTMTQYGLGVPPNKNIGVNIVWGEFDRSKARHAMPDMGSGMPPGGPGGEGGGMPPEGMNGGGERGRARDRYGEGMTSEKQEIWLKAQLAGEGEAANPPSKTEEGKKTD